MAIMGCKEHLTQAFSVKHLTQAFLGEMAAIGGSRVLDALARNGRHRALCSRRSQGHDEVEDRTIPRELL
jgi:hypothetical protein